MAAVQAGDDSPERHQHRAGVQHPKSSQGDTPAPNQLINGGVKSKAAQERDLSTAAS